MNCFFPRFSQCLSAELLSVLTISQLLLTLRSPCATAALTICQLSRCSHAWPQECSSGEGPCPPVAAWGGQGRAGSVAGGWGGHSSPIPRSSPPGLCHSAPHRQIPATRGEWQSSACSVPCPRGQAVPQDLGCWGLAACFAADLAPLQVLTLGSFSGACLRRFGWWWHLRQQLLSI